MLTRTTLALDDAVELLRAAGEHTRLRLLALLSDSDLTVTDLIEILGQSQPRISRHLRLLGEAGLLERYQEGAWAYFRAVDDGVAARIIADVLASMDASDPQLARDRERLETVRRKRSEQAAGYFARNAGGVGRASLAACGGKPRRGGDARLVGKKPIQSMLDLGTGTGRLLELFAPLYRRARRRRLPAAKCLPWRAPISTRAGLSCVRCARATSTCCRRPPTISTS